MKRFITFRKNLYNLIYQVFDENIKLKNLKFYVIII